MLTSRDCVAVKVDRVVRVGVAGWVVKIEAFHLETSVPVLKYLKKFLNAEILSEAITLIFEGPADKSKFQKKKKT